MSSELTEDELELLRGVFDLARDGETYRVTELVGAGVPPDMLALLPNAREA